MYRRRFLSVLIIAFMLAASVGFGPGEWGGVTSARAQVSASRCTYHVFVPLALRNFDGSSGAGTPTGFTPPDADFNGDGYADLAIGVPREGVFYDGAVRTDAGAVNILYGTGNGLDATGDQIFTQNDISNAIPEAQDVFGQALAAADFDGNGCTDLAVGVPSESIGTTDDAGAVYVFYGTPFVDGLDTFYVQTWYQGSSDILDSVEAYDSFGEALGAGDFDSDGYADLVIGVPFEEVGGYSAAGAFHVLYGSPSGLSGTADQFFSQSNVGNDLEAGDLFGSAFTAGDFDGDGYQDLAVGVPGETHELSSSTDAGAIYVLFGSSTGLLASNYFSSQSSIANEHFGSSLAAGDFDADGYTDLVVGAPDNSDEASSAGQVSFYYGADFGLTYSGTLDQGTEAAADEYFGQSLSAGDFNADGAADLVIGVPGESSIASSAGSIWVLHGEIGSGLPSTWDFVITQGSLTGDGAEADDEFGSALTTGDYNGDGAADLIVGVPRESLSSGEHQAGGVHEIYGFAGGGLTLMGDVFWTQDSADVDGNAETNDFFGAPLR